MNTDLTLEDVFLRLTSDLCDHQETAQPSEILDGKEGRTGAARIREMRSYFTSPIGYVVAAVLFALYGFLLLLRHAVRLHLFHLHIYSQQYVHLEHDTPAHPDHGRVFSEEQKNRTDQAPAHRAGGGWLHRLGQISLLPRSMPSSWWEASSPAIVIGFFSFSQLGVDLGTVIGSFLYGIAILAIGTFVSSLTQSQIVSAPWHLHPVGGDDQLTSIISNQVVVVQVELAVPNSRYTPFTTGTFILPVSCFFSAAAVFLFLTARSWRRRWS